MLNLNGRYNSRLRSLLLSKVYGKVMFQPCWTKE